MPLLPTGDIRLNCTTPARYDDAFHLLIRQQNPGPDWNETRRLREEVSRAYSRESRGILKDLSDLRQFLCASTISSKTNKRKVFKNPRY